MTASGPREVWIAGVELLVWLSISLGMWIYSYRFDLGHAVYELGVAHWPRAVILFMAMTAIFCFFERVHRSAATDGAAGAAEDQAAELGGGGGEPASAVVRLRIVGTFVVPLIYLWLMPRMGYFFTTPFFLAAYIFVFGESRWRVVIGASLGIYALMLLIFSKFLYVPLPTGNWPGFYDFSNALLIFLGSG